MDFGALLCVTEVLRSFWGCHKDPFEKNVFGSPSAGTVFLLCYSFDNFLKMKVFLCFAYQKSAVVMNGLLILLSLFLNFVAIKFIVVLSLMLIVTCII